MSEAAVSVEGVSKRFRVYHERNQSLKVALMRGRRARYEEFWALRDIDLEIPQGRTFGLIGHNGSGKSTLLKCLARILVPDSGSIQVRGKVSALLELGAGFHPELSGRDNVYLNGSILGLSKREIDSRFDDIVGFAGLEQFIDTPVKNYSSGMYVRLGFSVAINVDPEILMVDEVLAVGDEQFQQRCLEKFKQYRDEGRTVVVVSHALGSMRNMCDEVAWLDHGRLVEVGRPNDVVDEYQGASREDRLEVDDDEAADGGQRFGSGELRVERVEVLPVAGHDRPRTGDEVVFRLHWRTTRPVERPVFGLGLHTVEGQHVSGPNTLEAGRVPDRLDGSGVVELRVPRLMLLPGGYDVSVSAFDESLTHPYDFRTRALRVQVDAGLPRETHGVVSLGGTWTMPGAGG